jgi:hypothetical protein
MHSHKGGSVPTRRKRATDRQLRRVNNGGRVTETQCHQVSRWVRREVSNSLIADGPTHANTARCRDAHSRIGKLPHEETVEPSGKHAVDTCLFVCLSDRRLKKRGKKRKKEEKETKPNRQMRRR